MTNPLLKLLAVAFMLEVIARITGPKDHGPYLLSFTMAEPETDFERALAASWELSDER